MSNNNIILDCIFMQMNNITPSACRWILLGCCLTPPFVYSAHAQNTNETAKSPTEISVKQGFVEGRVFGTF